MDVLDDLDVAADVATGIRLAPCFTARGQVSGGTQLESRVPPFGASGGSSHRAEDDPGDLSGMRHHHHV
jgi:hypothetical protein